MNKRFSIYYLIAAYCGYTAYRLIKDIQEGAPTSTAMNIITVGFFTLAAIVIAIYTTILVRREKNENSKKDLIEKNSEEEKMEESKLQNEENNDS